jgi:hypothetical protein
LTYLCSNFSPFVINFHKGCTSYWCKGLHWGRWLTLEYCIFDRHHRTCWNDITCMLLLRYHKGSLTLIPLGRAPPLCHSMGHSLDNLKLLCVREHSSFDDHLKLRITCGTIVLHDRYHV